MFNVFPEILYKLLSLLFPFILLFSGSSFAALDYSDCLVESQEDYTGLRVVYEDYFPIGAAVFAAELDEPRLVDFILKNFNSITPEWELKQTVLNPQEGVWNFGPMDKLANFARENHLQLRGHTLIWPVQDVWMLWTDETRTTLVDKETLFARMESYIQTVMERYGDVIHIWDVVNEPFHYDRKWELKEDTNYFKIAGEEFATKAFEFAAKYADEYDVLMVNETFVEGNTAKTENMFACVERWLEQGIRIDGIGSQGHMGTVSTLPFDPHFNAVDDLAARCRAMGLKLEYTEIDMKLYEIERQRSVDKAPPAWLEAWQVFKYQQAFEALRRNRDVIIGATFWGLDDAHTVINYNESGKKDYPMLFDADGLPKQSFFAVCDF